MLAMSSPLKFRTLTVNLTVLIPTVNQTVILKVVKVVIATPLNLSQAPQEKQEESQRKQKDSMSQNWVDLSTMPIGNTLIGELQEK